MKRIDTVNVLCVSNLRVGYPMRQRYEAMLDIGLSVKGIDYTINQEHRSLLRYLGKISYWLFRHNIGMFPLLDIGDTNRLILEEVKKNIGISYG